MVEYLLGIIFLMNLDNLRFSFIDQIMSSKPVSFIPYTFDDLVNFLAVIDCFDVFQVQVR